MNKAEIDEQVRSICRMRRLSIHTERTYADWIKRFGRHVLGCKLASREERVRSFLEKLTQSKVVAFAAGTPHVVTYSKTA